MGSQAVRLADWDTAHQVGRRVAGPGAVVPAEERARMRSDLAELVPHAEDLIKDFTGMTVDGFRSRAWAMSRSEWTRANLAGIQRLIEPLAGRILETRPSRADFRRKALGAQIGVLLGYVSKKVLGQYDVFLPPDDEGLLYFVGPNMIEAERRFNLVPRDFRLWIAIHEVTHRVQFGAAPWLRTHLAGMVDAYLDSISLNSNELLDQLKRAVEQVRSGTDWRGEGAVQLLLNDAQRQLFTQMQGLMSLLEGHASFVMNDVARANVPDVDRMRRALQTRRKTGAMEKTFQRAIGFDQKIAQYDAGERFVRQVWERAGMEGLNLVWRSAEDLPSLDDIRDPDLWLARVTGL